MRNKVATTLLAAATVFLLVISAYGQQASPSDEAGIQQLHDAIKAMVENAPPAGSSLEAKHRDALHNIREQLRDALLEKNGALKQSIRNLQSQNALPQIQAYVQQLTEEQQRVESEIQSLKNDLAQTPTVAAVVTAPPVPSATASPTSGPTPVLLTKEQQEAKETFENAVKDFTPEKLKEAALSPATADAAASELKCKPDGTTSDPAPSEVERHICRLVQDAVNNKKLFLTRDKAHLFTILIAKLLKSETDASYAEFVTQAQERRTDQQVGASPTSSGTTSLVSKGGVPWALGFAVENGAATQTQSDTTVTFRISPAGLFSMMANKGFITGYRQSEKDPLLKFLRKTSVGLTFDTSRGDQSGVFTGDRQQLSEVTARFEFVNERDPRSKKYEKRWEKFASTELNRLNDQLGATSTILQKGWGEGQTFKDPALQAWLEQTNTLLGGSHFEVAEVERIIRKQVELVPVEAVSQETVQAVADFAKHFQEYSLKKKELLDEIAKGNVFTFEYTNKREVNAPDTSNFRFIAARGMQTVGRTIDFTANGSFTFFHSRPTPAAPTAPRPGRIRDFQFAGQVDVPFKLGKGDKAAQFIFWFTGRYERLMEDASMQVGTTVPNTKGDIAVGQFGLKVPIPGLGIQLPISFTIANRTELVKEKEVRGNFGFTFNLDSILARLKPF